MIAGGEKLPRSVLVVIHTPAMDVLLLHRQQPFDFWQSVTGSLEPDETPREAAVREVFEETGLSAPDYAFLDWGLNNRYPIPPKWRHRYAPEVSHNTETVFSLCLPTPLPITLDAAEHHGAEWLAARDAINRIWSWTNRDAVRLCARIDPRISTTFTRHLASTSQN